VLMRARKPWVRRRRIFDGWNVRFISEPSAAPVHWRAEPVDHRTGRRYRRLRGGSRPGAGTPRRDRPRRRTLTIASSDPPRCIPGSAGPSSDPP
jgi:hypothetical protein